MCSTSTFRRCCITLTESSLVQAAVYLAYGLMAIPAGLFITRWGYRRGVVFGLLLFTIDALGFIPCEAIGAFAPYLFALFILGCGLAFLETAASKAYMSSKLASATPKLPSITPKVATTVPKAQPKR